jgi:hypothetical protein
MTKFWLERVEAWYDSYVIAGSAAALISLFLSFSACRSTNDRDSRPSVRIEGARHPRPVVSIPL